MEDGFHVEQDGVELNTAEENEELLQHEADEAAEE